MALSINGLVSGLDTQSIISALVQAEGGQQQQLKTQQVSAQQTQSAYAALVTKLNAFGTAATTVANTDTWVGSSATSSSTSVTATATGTSTARLFFDVTSVAASHTVISAPASSTSDVIAPSGSITLTPNGKSAVPLSVGTGSLAEVVSAINGADLGLVASAIQTGTNAYRLQVASTATGAASSFTLGGIANSVLTPGADAKVHVGGSSVTGYDATSSTNTFSSIVPGMSFTVSKLETGVTVGSTTDGSAVATNIQAMVDAANAALSYIDTQSAWNAASRSGGPLNGESSVSALEQQILSTVSGAGAPGIALTSDGRLTFDATKFKTAFVADPKATAAAYGTSLSWSGPSGSSVTLSSATSAVKAGSYAVDVTRQPVREQWSLTPGSGANAIQLSRGTSTVSYTPAGGEALQTTADNLNQQLGAAGFGVVATVSGSDLLLTATSPGSGPGFSASLDGAAGTLTAVGLDVAGTIDGQNAVGSGDVLALAGGTGGALGLAVKVASTGPASGTVTVRSGLAKNLQNLMSLATATTTGTISAAQDGVAKHIKDLQTSIDDWTTRLTSYKNRLVTQFTAMETALSSLKTSMSALAGMINSMSTSSGSSSGSSG